MPWLRSARLANSIYRRDTAAISRAAQRPTCTIRPPKARASPEALDVPLALLKAWDNAYLRTEAVTARLEWPDSNQRPSG